MDDVKPRLRAGAFIAPLEDGAFIRASRGDCTLRGDGIYGAIKAIAPYLDGERSMQELIRGRSYNTQRKIASLVSRLIDAGAVRDASNDDALGPQEKEMYQGILGYLEQFHDDPVRRLHLLQEGTTMIVGRADGAEALIGELSQLGLRNVSVDRNIYGAVFGQGKLKTFPSLAEATSLHAVLAANRIGMGQHVRGVFGCFERADLDHVTALDDLCRESGWPFFCAYSDSGDSALLIRSYPDSPICVRCVASRVNGHVDTLDRRPATASGWLGDHRWRILAGMMTTIWVDEMTSTGGEAATCEVTAVDWSTLQTDRLSVPPMPGCKHCGTQDFRSRTTAIAEASRPSSLVDKRVGFISELGTRDLLQMPLQQVLLHCHPTSDPRWGGLQTVFAGTRVENIRRLAVVSACQSYSSAVATAWGLLDRDVNELARQRVGLESGVRTVGESADHLLVNAVVHAANRLGRDLVENGKFKTLGRSSLDSETKGLVSLAEDLFGRQICIVRVDLPTVYAGICAASIVDGDVIRVAFRRTVASAGRECARDAVQVLQLAAGRGAESAGGGDYEPLSTSIRRQVLSDCVIATQGTPDWAREIKGELRVCGFDVGIEALFDDWILRAAGLTSGRVVFH